MSDNLTTHTTGEPKREGLGVRFKQPMVMHPESSVFILCGCGKSFNYFGAGASEKARAFMREHACHLGQQADTFRSQRIDE